MTRQNYQAIANLIVTARDTHQTPEADEALNALTYMLSGYFGADNPQFKPEKFQLAAGAR